MPNRPAEAPIERGLVATGASIGAVKPMYPPCGGWRQPTSLRSAGILRPALATSALRAELKPLCCSEPFADPGGLRARSARF